MHSAPSHVPADRVIDFDYLASEPGSDIYAWFARLHDGPDIFWTPRHGGHWVVTRHDDIAAVLSDPATFSSRHQTIPAEGVPLRMPPIELDPPLHGEFRRLIAPFFTPRAIGDLEQTALALSRALIDRFEARGSCDFMREFAFEMPIGIFLSLVDLPDDDRLFLLEQTDAIVRGATPDVQIAGFEQIFGYLARKYDERRLAPGKDMLSALLLARIEGGRPLTHDELMGMGVLLLVGGLDTVAGLMGFIMLHLTENDDQRRALAAEPGRIPAAVEELMRRFSIANVSRVVVADIEFRGVTMKAGDMILAATSLAGIDDRQYPDPMTVDFDRVDKRSLVFGRGPHMCIGAFLARTELKVFLAEWLSRIPDFAIAPGERPTVASGRANAVFSLPLVWSVKQ